MSTPQTAILPQAGPFALYVQLKVIADPQQVIKQLAGLEILCQSLNDSHRAELVGSVAFSAPFLDSLGMSYPSDMKPFETLGSGDTLATATQDDVLLHLHSTRHDLHFYVLSKLLEGIADKVEVTDETYGFRYLDSRDLTGFVDGTENPITNEARREVALIEGGEFSGGSLVLAQRFEHKIPAWNSLSVKQQEAKIGRTKPDSIELEDVPSDSHVGRVDIKENGKGLKIVRHSLPFGSVSGPHGLLFLSYCNNLHNIEAMLRSMYGETDGVTDQILHFSQAVRSGYYFAPSQELLSQMAQ